MTRINLFGNTARAEAVQEELNARQHHVSIVTSEPQNGEPGWRFRPCWPYQPECDVLIAVNWRKWIYEDLRTAAKYGAFCLHDSLLPAYRGCSPVVWAVEEGAKETGVTMFRMTDQIDAGPIIGQRRMNIEGKTLRQAWESLTPLYVDLVRAHLPAILNGTIVEYPQDPTTLQPIRKRREWPK